MNFVYVVTYFYTPIIAYVDQGLAENHAQAIGGEVYSVPLFPLAKYIVGPDAANARD